MAPVAEKLDAKLKSWPPQTATRVEQMVEEIISLAESDSLDLLRSREREQEVLDLLDEPTSR